MILLALMLAVSNGYTNHAGNVIAGFPVALTKTPGFVAVSASIGCTLSGVQFLPRSS